MLNPKLKKCFTAYAFKNFVPRTSFINISMKLFTETEYTIPRFKIDLSNEYDLAKRQVFWRIRNIGQLELEFLLMKWFDQQNMNLDQLREFTKEVLEMENPEMNKYFVKFDAPPENFNYTKKIQHDIMNTLYK
jgi:succinate dehydrogenase flavin-adding protein (antitoxin of CptAB toxin-antitoxin module)